MDITSNTVLTTFINQPEVEEVFFHNISREKLSGNFGLVDFHVHWPDGLVANVLLLQAHTSLLMSKTLTQGVSMLA